MEKKRSVLLIRFVVLFYVVLVGARGFEPPTTCTPCRYATRLRYAPKSAIIAELRFNASGKKPFSRRGRQTGAFTTGRDIVIVVPLPGSLTTAISPSCRDTTARTNVMPRPSPSTWGWLFV